MGTNVNQLAWDNAEIAARMICDNGKYSTLANAFLYFGSFTPSEAGKFSVQGCEQCIYTMGNNTYSFNGLQINIPDLTRILYETFYKHQF